MIKTLQKVSIEGTSLNIIKAIYDKPTANNLLNDEKLEQFSLRSGTRQVCPLAHTFFQHSFGSPSYGNQRIKEIRGIQIGAEVKLSLFADDILYVVDPKGVTRQLLEVTKEFSKVAGYKVNTENSLAFIYTNKERSERATKETIPSVITSKRIKYLGINLLKEVKDMYSENCQMLMKEMNDDTNTWKYTLCS